jgi:hypothetical protein
VVEGIDPLLPVYEFVRPAVVLRVAGGATPVVFFSNYVPVKAVSSRQLDLDLSVAVQAFIGEGTAIPGVATIAMRYSIERLVGRREFAGRDLCVADMAAE